MCTQHRVSVEYMGLHTTWVKLTLQGILQWVPFPVPRGYALIFFNGFGHKHIHCVEAKDSFRGILAFG